MSTLLAIPRPQERGRSARVRSTRWIPLRFLPALGEGIDGEAMVTPEGTLVDAETFRQWRDDWGAWIETSERPRICAALGVPLHESGILVTTPDDADR